MSDQYTFQHTFSPRMEIIRLHVERVGIELRIKALREEILREKAYAGVAYPAPAITPDAC